MADLDLADVMAGVHAIERASARGWHSLLDLVAAADDDQLDRIVTAATGLADAAREIDGRRHG